MVSLEKMGVSNLTPNLCVWSQYNVVYHEKTNFKMAFVVAMRMGFGIAKIIVLNVN
jgi:hypothetical protein